MTFDDVHKNYTRLEAMKVAKEQASIREKAADYTREGRQVPEDLVKKYNKTLRQKLRSGRVNQAPDDDTVRVLMRTDENRDPRANQETPTHGGAHCAADELVLNSTQPSQITASPLRPLQSPQQCQPTPEQACRTAHICSPKPPVPAMPTPTAVASPGPPAMPVAAAAIGCFMAAAAVAPSDAARSYVPPPRPMSSGPLAVGSPSASLQPPQVARPHAAASAAALSCVQQPGAQQSAQPTAAAPIASVWLSPAAGAARVFWSHQPQARTQAHAQAAPIAQATGLRPGSSLR